MKVVFNTTLNVAQNYYEKEESFGENVRGGVTYADYDS